MRINKIKAQQTKNRITSNKHKTAAKIKPIAINVPKAIFYSTTNV
jgi:hypothetical protein